MALRRNKEQTKPAEESGKSANPGDTLSRIEAVTDRLEWLAEQIEKQLEERETRKHA